MKLERNKARDGRLRIGYVRISELEVSTTVTEDVEIINKTMDPFSIGLDYEQAQFLLVSVKISKLDVFSARLLEGRWYRMVKGVEVPFVPLNGTMVLGMASKANNSDHVQSLVEWTPHKTIYEGIVF